MITVGIIFIVKNIKYFGDQIEDYHVEFNRECRLISDLSARLGNSCIRLSSGTFVIGLVR